MPTGKLTPFSQIDVQIATYHLMDHIEWDLLSPLTPEDFARQLCSELGLAGEAIPLIAHAIHEELMKHKKDAVEWGVIGGDKEPSATAVLAAGAEDGRGSGGIFVKDKTGLGHSWGRTPRDGRGPKTLRSVWRDWADAEEYSTRFEVLTAEEVERREIEKERASRSVSKCILIICVSLTVSTTGGYGGRHPNSRAPEIPDVFDTDCFPYNKPFSLRTSCSSLNSCMGPHRLQRSIHRLD